MDKKTIDKYYKNIIVQLDFTSLYPAIMIMANLFARKEPGEKGYAGDNFFELEGIYDDKEMHPVGKLLRKFFYLRILYKRKGVLENGQWFQYKEASKYIGQKYKYTSDDIKDLELHLKTITPEIAKELVELSKEKDLREYTIKILINSIYGILSNPYYTLVYDLVRAADCTRLGRQFVKLARKRFREAGYPIVYSDTDSWYFVDIYNDKEKYVALKNKLIEEIKSHMPFPQDTFDSDIDAEIKHIYFFKGQKEKDDFDMDEDDHINKPKGFMKKNYIYVDLDDKITIKNLGIAKKSISPLSKKIFWEKIVPHLKQGKHKFYKTQIKNWIIEYLEQDITLSYLRRDVKDLKHYSKSLTGQQAQISKKYGDGVHFMIPNNKRIGIGKESIYCTDEEFKKLGMTISDINLNVYLKELNYFIKPKEDKGLQSYTDDKIEKVIDSRLEQYKQMSEKLNGQTH